MRKKYGIITCIIITVFMTIIFSMTTNKAMSSVPSRSNLDEDNLRVPAVSRKIQALNSHPRVIITANTQFTSNGFVGSGTKLIPYKLIGINITESTGDLISISNTDAYFIIEDSLLNGTGTANHGFILHNVTNGIIQNNSIWDNQWNNVKLEESSNITITNNTIAAPNTSPLGNGIFLGASSDCNISNNHIFNTENAIMSGTDAGTHAFGSINTSVINNTVYDNVNGIWLDNTRSSMVRGNTVYQTSLTGNTWGIHLTNTINNTISGNEVYHIEFAIQLEQNNNTNTLIINNTIHDNTNSISNDGSGNSIVNNTVNDNGGGIGISGDNNIISNNSIYSAGTNFLGISLSNSNDNNISSNTIFQTQLQPDTGQIGINIGGSDNIIRDNTIYNLGFTAIQLGGVGSTNNRIFTNTIFNSKHGIIVNANDNNLSKNIIYNNEWGVLIGGSLNNITVNDFSNNQVVQDDGSNNVFMNNYWSDWTGTGSYTISGSAGNQDSSPLTNPYHLSAPVFTAPTSETLTLKDNVTLQWNASTDMFSHSINYTVFYSTDDGVTWIEIASGLTTTNYTLDTNTISDGTFILFKVQTIDSVGFTSKMVSEEVFLIANAPHQLSTPSLIFPTGGETLSGNANISWTASVDTWGYEVVYNISYSTDGGTTWTLITTNQISISFIWDTSTVSDGSNYIVKVEVSSSDGLNATFIPTSPFTIANPTTTTTPAITIPPTTTTTTTTTTAASTSFPGFLSVLLFFSIFVVVIRRYKKT